MSADTKPGALDLPSVPPVRKPSAARDFPAMYFTIYPMLANIARENGYALAVHGSIGRDFDLIATPWTDEAVAPELLIAALRDGSATLVQGTGVATAKPHGRLCWNLELGAGAYLDVSVIPRGQDIPALVAEVEKLRASQPPEGLVWVTREELGKVQAVIMARIQILADIEAWDKDDAQGPGEAVGLVCGIREALEECEAPAPSEAEALLKSIREQVADNMEDQTCNWIAKEIDLFLAGRGAQGEAGT